MVRDCPLRVLPEFTLGSQAGAVASFLEKQYVVLDASAEQRRALLGWATRQRQALVDVDVFCGAGLAGELRGLGLRVSPLHAAGARGGRMLFALLLRHPLEPATPAEDAVLAEAGRQSAVVAASIATADRVVSRTQQTVGERGLAVDAA